MIRKKRMSKGIAKILSGLLVFGMVAGLVPAVPGGTVHAKAEGESEQNVTAEPHIHCVCGKDELSVEGHTHDKEQTWTGIDSLDKISNAGYYYLTDNVDLTDTWTPQDGVVLCLNGKAITMKADNKDVIEVNGNNRFTLCDCKDTGIVTHGTNPDTKTKYSGGGVTVTGIFIMYGGTICNNNSAYGGGVYIFSTGALEMFGGKISENEAGYGGGVCGYGQKVTMKGGIISNNTSRENGGGVYLASGTFDMSGGTITNNTSKALGGGVYKEAGTFNMSGGAAIIDNTSTTLGGGVYNAAGTFNMSGGEIKGNKSGTSGGGVYNAPDSSAKIIMSGQAEISKNTATSKGGGVFVSSNDATTLSDAVKITENKVGNTANNLYLSSNTTLQAACLNGREAIVGVTTEKEPTENSPVTITSDDARPQGFRSDRDEYELEYSNTNRYVVMKKKKTCTVEVYIHKNVIKQQGSGELKQEVTEGSNIVPIVLEAATGYYFKDEDISKLNTASVKVTKLVDDGSRIQIECTPNNDIVISLLAFEKPAIEKPKIIKQPQPVSVKVGETATFTVEAAGEGLSYQWQIKAGKGGWDDITDANTSSYTTTAVVPNCNGFEYRCVVSNSAGSVNSDSATLTVDTTIPPTPEPNPEPKPEPTPDPAPAPNPTPDPAPATSTPAASTSTAPASSAAAAPVQVTYDILDGAGSSWTQNTDGSLAIRGSGEISKFREVKVDGVTVDPVNYTVTEGSTIITFKPEYLKSLPVGNHSFELVWTDGTAATNFTVAENTDQSAKSPKTGEDFSMALCTALLMVSCAGLAGMFVRRKKSSLR